MTYNKPEVITLDHALYSIQGTKKGQLPVHDSVIPNQLATPAAYEADE